MLSARAGGIQRIHQSDWFWEPNRHNPERNGTRTHDFVIAQHIARPLSYQAFSMWAGQKSNAVLHKLGAYAGDVFEPRAATGSELFPYLTRLHSTTLVSLSIFSLVDTSGENHCPSEIFTSGFRLWVKNVACWSSLMWALVPDRFLLEVSFPC